MNSENIINLKPNHRAFVENYVTTWNGTVAAVAAGYSPRTATVQASKLLTDPNIKKEVERLRLKQVKAYQLTREGIQEQLRKLAFSDHRKLMKEDGTPKRIIDLEDDEAMALDAIEVDALGQPYKFKFHNKNKAIDSINKMLGYNAPDKVLNLNPPIEQEDLSKFTMEEIKDILYGKTGRPEGSTGAD